MIPQLSQLLTVYLPALLIDFAFGGLLTNTAFYTSYLGLSSTFLGGLMALTTAFFVFLAIPFGRLSDRLGRRHVLYAACLLLGAASIGLPFCRNAFHLLLIFPTVGISMALFWPAYEAWLAEREAEDILLQRVMFFNLFWSIGMTLGPTASGYLYHDANPFAPFYLAAAFSALTFATFFFNKPEPSVPTPLPESERLKPDSPSPAVRATHLNLARCANFASWFALGILRQITPKLTLEMGIPTQTFGNLMLTLGTLQTAVFLLLGTRYSTRWHYRLAPLLTVQILAILSFIGLWQIQRTPLWACAFGVIGISAAFTYFSSLYYGLDRQKDKGNKSGWHEATLGVGILLGPFFGGIAADSPLGVQSPYLLCAVAIGIAIVIELFMHRRIASFIHRSE